MNDTIVAIATPPGSGAIGIVRLSGPMARGIGQSLFVSGSSAFSGFAPYRLHHGQIRDAAGRFVDDALVAFMPEPKSFTGEDVLEIHCHGGAAILRRVVEECLAGGARLAGPGEFSKRAFMHGRMDLTQAEAIMELVNASSDMAVGFAGAKLQGLLGQRISGLRTMLEGLRVQMCVAVDFPEEEVECLPSEEMSRTLLQVRQAMSDLAGNFDRARCWRDGAHVVLAGQVNAGKSSLMNAILGINRAIVTDIPGTTRDYLEESVQLDGLPVRLVDTAGLRDAQDNVELMGIARTRALMDQADLVLLVMDAELGPGAEDLDLAMKRTNLLVVANKMDLLAEEPVWFTEAPWTHLRISPISAKSGLGLTELLTAIRQAVLGVSHPDAEALVPNLRQRDALVRAGLELEAMIDELSAGMPYDVLSVRLDHACATLGQITGKITSEDVLRAVFDGFCIGK